MKPTFEDMVQALRETFNEFTVPITESTTAPEVPGWDSLNHVVLLLEFEDRFGVTMTAEETAELPDVGALYSMLVARAA